MTIKDNNDGTLLVTLTAKEQDTNSRKPGALETYLTSWLESWGREFASSDSAIFKAKYDRLEIADQTAVVAILDKTNDAILLDKA